MAGISNAVARQDKSPTSVIQQYKAEFAAVLPKHVDPEQWLRLSTAVFRNDDALLKALERNPHGVLNELRHCARLGLEVGETFHIVPFGNDIQGIADYTGLIELMFRAGQVLAIKAYVVHANDEFEYDPGTMNRPRHRPDWFGERGEMIGAYAYAELKGGTVSDVIIRSKKEIEQVKAVSRGSNSPSSPWNKWPDRMWKKTVIRELSKFVPTSSEIRSALAHEDGRPTAVAPMILPAVPVDPETGELQDEGERTVEAAVSPLGLLFNAMDAAGYATPSEKAAAIFDFFGQSREPNTLTPEEIEILTATFQTQAESADQ